MKAYRNVAGNVIEIDIDLDLDGNPILPPDTTVDPRPEPLDGHYVTVVDKAWVQIAIPQVIISFDTMKQNALDKLKAYRDWYLEQPVTHSDIKFDGDAVARNRLIQALVIYQTNGYLPPAWVTYDNGLFPLAAVADLTNLITTVQTAFSTRFFETDTIRQQILAAQTEADLNAVIIPAIAAQLILIYLPVASHW